MNRSSFALFVALLIHLVLLLIFWILGTIAADLKEAPKKEEKKYKVSLKEMPKKYKTSGDIKKKTPPTQIAPPMPKGSQLKKIVENPLKYESTKEAKEPTLNRPKTPTKPKEKPKPKVEPLPPQKPYIPLLSKKKDENTTKESKPKNSMAWLYEDRSSQEKGQKSKKIAMGGNISQDIKELYGDEFGKLTPGQQKYILDNREIMRRITQEVLTRVARVNLKENLNVNRTNVIEFKLHPNGDMTDFKFLEKSGYYVLDNTTEETISYAYSRYPRPKEIILIRYNVFYNLARH